MVQELGPEARDATTGRSMSSAASGDPVIIIGAGPAGLAAAQTLAKRNIDYVILEKGSSVASALRRVDPEMRLLSPTALSLMPDMKIEPGAPTYLPFKRLVHELERYQQQHESEGQLSIAQFSQCERERVGFSVRYRTGDGEESSIRGSHVINATGIISKPRLPDNFKPVRRPAAGCTVSTRVRKISQSARKLLVVGGGASAAEVLENWLRVRQEDDRAWLSLRSRLFADATLDLWHRRSLLRLAARAASDWFVRMARRAGSLSR